MNRDKIIADIAYANRRELEEMVVSLEFEKQELEEENCSHLRKLFQRERSKAVEGWNKVIELEKENERYEQALEFYADERNYSMVEPPEILMDFGDTASQVLDDETK